LYICTQITTTKQFIMTTTAMNTLDTLFPFTDKEIRFLNAEASLLEVSKDDINLSDYLSVKALSLYEERKNKGQYPFTLKYMLGRSYFLMNGKLLA